MNLKSLLSKYQGYILGIAILLASIAISIRGSGGEVNLVLHDYPVVIFFIGSSKFTSNCTLHSNQ